MQMNRIQKEIQALLLDSRGKLPSVLADQGIIAEALAMREKIGEDYAMTYLQFKGMSPEKAADVLKTSPPVH